MAQYAVLTFEQESPTRRSKSRPRSWRRTEPCPTASPRKAAKIVAGMALEPSGTATAIRGDLVTDGPFIKTKEALAGVFVLEARDLDPALAKLTPIVNGGSRSGR